MNEWMNLSMLDSWDSFCLGCCLTDEWNFDSGDSFLVLVLISWIKISCSLFVKVRTRPRKYTTTKIYEVISVLATGLQTPYHAMGEPISAKLECAHLTEFISPLDELGVCGPDRILVSLGRAWVVYTWQNSSSRYRELGMCTLDKICRRQPRSLVLQVENVGGMLEIARATLQNVPARPQNRQAC
jgi:hypothetical protein